MQKKKKEHRREKEIIKEINKIEKKAEKRYNIYRTTGHTKFRTRKYTRGQN